MSLFRPQRPQLGITADHLAECPGSPNCVATETSRADRRMEPIPFSGPADEALLCLRAVLIALPRVRIVEATDRYLRAEFRSAVFRFVDDVEFLLDVERRLIHFRSASRVGQYDFGVNRRRMEMIRERYARGERPPLEG